MPPTSAIPAGSTVLVTGANGYLASHVVDQLLASGYHVRGTVRSQEKGEWLTKLFSEEYASNRFHLAVVPDMSAPDAFTEAMHGCAGVAHVASDLSFSPNAEAVIPGVEKAVEHILASAAKHPEIKRFVLTSSSAAAVFPVPNKRFKITENSWNDLSVEQAWKKGDVEAQGYHVYCASKVAAEKALWKFMETHKPHFEANSVLPNLIVGKVLGRKWGQFGSTGGMVVGLYADQGEKRDASENMLKMLPPQWMINSGDTARLHVAALTDSDIRNERIFAFAETYTINEILEDLRALRPDHQFPADIDDNSHDLSEVVPRERAEQILVKHFDRGFTGLGKSIEEALEAADEDREDRSNV